MAFVMTVTIYSRTLLRSLSRDQRIRDFLSGKTYNRESFLKAIG
jgi:hypothetical protein